MHPWTRCDGRRRSSQSHGHLARAISCEHRHSSCSFWSVAASAPEVFSTPHVRYKELGQTVGDIFVMTGSSATGTSTGVTCTDYSAAGRTTGGRAMGGPSLYTASNSPNCGVPGNLTASHGWIPETDAILDTGRDPLVTAPAALPRFTRAVGFREKLQRA